MLAAFLITACGSSSSSSSDDGNNGNTGKKTGINTFALEYKGGSYTNKIKHTLSLLPSQNSIPPEAKAVYTLTSDPSNDKITVNPADGKITAAIAKDDPTGDYKLTVTASADNANYTGSKTSPVFTVTVDNALKQNISAYSLIYGTIPSQIKTGGDILLTGNTIPPEASADFSADNLGTGINIDGATGKITVGGTALDGTHDITVTASVPAGNTVYTGTKSVPVSFYVISAAGYKPDAEQAASKGFFTAGDIDNPALVSLTGVTDVLTVTDPKIEIKTGGNIIFDGTGTTKATYDGKVTLGIPAGQITHANFKAVAADATIDITVSAKVNGKNIAKTFIKTKTPFTDIYSWRDLDKVRNDLGASYTLKNGIAFPVENTYGYTDTFNPIGDLANHFTGTFDGTGKTISGLKITGTAMDYRGLFAKVTGNRAWIKNLVIDHRGISGKDFVGAFAGQLNGTVITNVGMISTTGAKVTGDSNVGGLAGEVTISAVTNSTVTGYATGAVSGNDFVGGLTGLVNTGTVTGYATGAVSGKGAVGGLTGAIIISGTVTGYATGAISGTGNVGGLVGNFYVLGNVVTAATVTGYTRNKVIRSSGTVNSFGLLAGNNAGTGIKKGYHSATESSVVDSTGTSLTGTTTGISGDPVTMAPGITQTTFDKANTANPGHFTFGSAIGEWTWVANGKWPAINIGTIKPPSAQPTGEKPTTP